MVNYAAQFKNNTVLTFHGIREDGSMTVTPAEFEDLIDYISRRNVDVITYSDLKKDQLAD